MADTPAETPSRQSSGLALASLLLLLMAALSIGSIRRESLTYDEIVHLSAGLAFWQQHDTRLSPEHPPLLRMIAAVPLVVSGVRPDYSSPTFCGAAACTWWFAKQFLERLPKGTVNQIVFLGRLPMVVLNLILGGVLYWLARRFWGSRAALVVLAAFSTSPFFIGYGSLIITDVGLVLFVLLSCWTFASLLESPSIMNLLSFALATAAALLAKFSAVLLVPAMLLSLVWWSWRRKQSLSSISTVYWVILGWIVTAVFIFAFYAVFTARTWPPSLLADQIHSMPPGSHVRNLAVEQLDCMQRHPALIRPLQPLWLNLTGTWRLISQFEHNVYVLGSWKTGGAWYYFPALTLFKTSPGVVMFWLMIPVLALGRRSPGYKKNVFPRNLQTHAVMLLSAFVIFVLSAMLSDVNIGIRHFSVPMALLILATGLVPSLLGESTLSRNAQRAALAGPVLACMLTAASVYPDYLPYFNFLHDSIPKQEIAIDSNLDWGQALPALEEFRANHNIREIWVNAFSLLDPALYVTGARQWVCGHGIPSGAEWLAVSANWMISAQPSCAYLLRYEHTEIGGGAMYVIHVH